MADTHYKRRGSLAARVPRVKRPDGTTLMVEVPWAERYTRWTKAFGSFAIMVLKGARSTQQGCDLLGIGWEMAQRIMKRAVERGLEERDLKDVRYAGVDEKSFKRGQDYVTALTDLERGRVLEVTEGRSQESAKEAIGGLPAEVRQAVEAVAADFAPSYRAAVMEMLPSAVLVLDKFHAMQLLGKAVDEVRRAEHRRRLADKDETLTGTRPIWLKAVENLGKDDYLRLKELMALDVKVGRAWVLKEQFRHFWSRRDRRRAVIHFKEWCSRAMRSGLKPIKRCARTFRERLEELLNYYQHPITNAVSEGLNSRIQALKANARGFRSFANYRISILFHLGGLDMTQ